jgi:hypothetical protein
LVPLLLLAIVQFLWMPSDQVLVEVVWFYDMRAEGALDMATALKHALTDPELGHLVVYACNRLVTLELELSAG